MDHFVYLFHCFRTSLGLFWGEWHSTLRDHYSRFGITSVRLKSFGKHGPLKAHLVLSILVYFGLFWSDIGLF